MEAKIKVSDRKTPVVMGNLATGMACGGIRGYQNKAAAPTILPP